jgi:hypothetical protein
MRTVRPQLKGRCNFCGATYTRLAMARHVEVCIGRWKGDQLETSGTREELLHLAVKGDNGRFTYWMYVQGNADMTLKDLDAFLRDTWLECCGHLSQFTISGVNYSIDPDPDTEDRSMKAKLGDVLRVGETFTHEYDFGTTTVLTLKVISTRQASAERRRRKIVALARNDSPQITCDVCDRRKATEVCAQCIWGGGKAWFCDNCAPKHRCVREVGEEMLRPVVNSPRVGLCGYTGHVE